MFKGFVDLASPTPTGASNPDYGFTAAKTPDPGDGPPFVVAGTAILGVGLVAVAVGVYMWATNGTSVRAEPQ
jgi:hypothetical protein